MASLQGSETRVKGQVDQKITTSYFFHFNLTSPWHGMAIPGAASIPLHLCTNRKASRFQNPLSFSAQPFVHASGPIAAAADARLHSVKPQQGTDVQPLRQMHETHFTSGKGSSSASDIWHLVHWERRHSRTCISEGWFWETLCKHRFLDPCLHEVNKYLEFTNVS